MSADRRAAVTLTVGGLAMMVGGQLHPREGKATVTETLAGYFASPTWDSSHLLVLVGTLVATAGLLLVRQAGSVDFRLRRQLLVTAVCWALAEQ